MGYDKAFTADIVDLGANPHVSVKATNVPSMRFKVWYINPLGKQYDLGYVQADGSTLSGQFYGPWRYLKNGSPL